MHPIFFTSFFFSTLFISPTSLVFVLFFLIFYFLHLFPYISSSLLVVSFPKPLSPLLDIHVIVGDDTRLGKMVACFEEEVQSKSFTPWKSLEWFQNEL